MRKKHLIAMLAVIIAMPLAAAHGDTSTSGTDCGSKPAPPARPAAGIAPTADQIAQFKAFRTQMQAYDTCMGIKPNGGGRGFGMRVSMGLKGENNANGQNRCTLINQRITERINNFQKRQSGDKTIFGNLYGRLENIETRISNAGVDTGKLKTDLSTLQTDIDKVNTDYATAISDFQKVQGENSTCGQSGSSFESDLLAARTQLNTVRADRLAVRSFVTGTIIPDIQALRKQLQNKKGATDSTNTSSN